MLHFIYTQPLSRVIIIMAIAIAIWGYTRSKLYGKKWNIVNALLACGMVVAILGITIFWPYGWRTYSYSKAVCIANGCKNAKRSLPRAPDEHLSFLSIWLDAIQRFTTKLGEMAEDRPYGDNSLIAQRGH